MAFYAIPARHGGNGSGRRALASEVCVQVVKNKNGSQLLIRVARNVGNHLGWQKGDRFDILFGAEEDFGKVLLRRTPNGSNGYPHWSTGKAALQFTTSRLPANMVRRCSTMSVPFVTDAGGITVTLPAAFWQLQAAAE